MKPIRILFLLTIPAALALIWFVNGCDVIPEVYPLQRNWAWAGWSIALFGLLLLIGLRLAKKLQFRIWPGVLLFVVLFICMSFRLYIKQDGRWFAGMSLYDERKYIDTWLSKDKTIELYHYASMGFFGGYDSESIWLRKGKSIYMILIVAQKYSRIEKIQETETATIINWTNINWRDKKTTTITKNDLRVNTSSVDEKK